MTDAAPWIKFQAKNKVDILGSFENVHGERFVIWRNEYGTVLYFTGDEVDWEPKTRLWPSDFTFTDEERERVAKILWLSPAMVMLGTENASRLADVTYSPEIEQRPEMIAWRKEHNVPALSWDARHPVGS